MYSTRLNVIHKNPVRFNKNCYTVPEFKFNNNIYSVKNNTLMGPDRVLYLGNLLKTTKTLARGRRFRRPKGSHRIKFFNGYAVVWLKWDIGDSSDNFLKRICWNFSIYKNVLSFDFPDKNKNSSFFLWTNRTRKTGYLP